MFCFCGLCADFWKVDGSINFVGGLLTVLSGAAADFKAFGCPKRRKENIRVRAVLHTLCSHRPYRLSDVPNVPILDGFVLFTQGSFKHGVAHFVVGHTYSLHCSSFEGYLFGS